MLFTMLFILAVFTLPAEGQLVVACSISNGMSMALCVISCAVFFVERFCLELDRVN